MFIKDYGNGMVINVDMICRFSILHTGGSRDEYDVELSMADSDIVKFKGFNSRLEAEHFIDVIIEFKFREDPKLSSVSYDFIMATVKARMRGNK